MVDNINPIPQNPQNPVEQPAQPQPLASSAPFYQGFDKPAEVHVNLADMGQAPAPQNVTEPINNPVPVQPETNQISDFRTPEAPLNHDSYTNVGEQINWRGVAFIAGVGVVVVALFSLVSYFSASYIYGRQLTDAQDSLKAAQQKLSREREVPSALELPKTETPPPTSTPTTSAPVEQAPIQTPATAPVVAPNGGTEANG